MTETSLYQVEVQYTDPESGLINAIVDVYETDPRVAELVAEDIVERENDYGVSVVESKCVGARKLPSLAELAEVML